MTTTPIPAGAFAGHQLGKTTLHLMRPGTGAARFYSVLCCSGRSVRDAFEADPFDTTLTDCKSCDKKFGNVRRAARVAAELDAEEV